MVLLYIRDLVKSVVRMEFSSTNLSSTTDRATDYYVLSWAHGLRKSGLYYSGFVENIDWILEQHRKDTITLHVHVRVYKLLFCIQINKKKQKKTKKCLLKLRKYVNH